MRVIVETDTHKAIIESVSDHLPIEDVVDMAYRAIIGVGYHPENVTDALGEYFRVEAEVKEATNEQSV